jgi:hypothetical protein
MPLSDWPSSDGARAAVGWATLWSSVGGPSAAVRAGAHKGDLVGREQFLPDDHGEQRIRRSRTPGAEGRDSSSPSPPFSPVVHNLWTTGERKMLSSARPTGAPVDGVEHHPARVAPLTAP